MKTHTWIKKLLHIYTFNLVLVLGQITAIGAPLSGFANTNHSGSDAITSSGTTTSNQETVDSAFVPPGFTAADFKVVEEQNRIAEANRNREQNRNAGKKEIEHDISSSKCRTRAANKAERMDDITTYRAITGQQGYDEICRLRAQLNQQTGGPEVQCNGLAGMSGNSAQIDRGGQLQDKDGKYKDDPGGTVANFETEDWEQKKKEADERLATAKTEVEKWRRLAPIDYNAYERKRSQCEDRSFGCMSRSEREELERLREKYLASSVQLRDAETEMVAAQKHHDNYGKVLRSEEGNMDVADADTLKNDEDMKESDAFSGVGEGENGALSGPVFETNEKLKESIDRYTSNAAQYAEEKINYVRDLEFRNENRGEYELYELSLADYDETTPNGRMALSNLDVMAMASSAIKKLDCSKRDQHESKAYHIFRAASATYVSAIVRDKGSDQDYQRCIQDEVFNEEEENDQQFEAVEKATNAHTQIVDTMCTMVNPDPENIPEIGGIAILPKDQVIKLKEICDASAGVGCAEGQEDGCAPRTRETALEMYRTALMIAQHELADKRQLVTTAETNVAKGKKKIKATKRKIIVSNALAIMNWVLRDVYRAIGTALNASICACGAPFIFIADGHWTLKVFWAAQNIYYISELIRWTNFTKKWERKLDEAQNHTHLACNFDEAEAANGVHVAFAEKTSREAKKAHQKAKDEVLGFMDQEGLGALDKKTGFFRMPDGLDKKYEKDAVEIYLKKYMKLVGQTAFDLVFPTAFAADTTTGSNNEEALPDGMADTQLSAKAAGMAVGSTSFYHFVLRQNEHWQDQSFDADYGNEGKGTGYDHEDNPIMYCNEASVASGSTSASGCIKDETVGMATPETRIRLISNSVALVEENLSGLLDHLNTAVDQRDKYVKLLNQMRNAMTLGVSGTDTQLEEKPVVQVKSCMKRSNSGGFEIDAKCTCEKSGSCASLQYPDLGSFAPGVVAESEAAIKEFADADLSGKLKKANVAAGRLKKNSNAVRRRITDNFRKINKEREEKKLNSIDYAKKAKEAIVKSRLSTMEKYAKIFPAAIKEEKTRGGLSSYYNDANLGAGDGQTKKNPLLAAVGKKVIRGAVNTGKASGGSKANPKKGFNFEFNWDDDLTAEEMAMLKKQREDAEALAAISGASAEGDQARYKHKRSISDKNGSADGINKNTKMNIFGIISSRYKKSAFPIFLGDSPL